MVSEVSPTAAVSQNVMAEESRKPDILGSYEVERERENEGRGRE